LRRLGNTGESRSRYDGVQRKFFRERASLKFLDKYRPEAPSVSYENIDGFIATIISEKQATLNELRTIYSLEDAFNMWEVIAVNRYNEHLAIEHSKKQNK
jgi:hypothetical protein